MRVNITLECTECHEQTYLTNKNKRNNPDRLELKLGVVGDGHAFAKLPLVQAGCRRGNQSCK